TRPLLPLNEHQRDSDKGVNKEKGQEIVSVVPNWIHCKGSRPGIGPDSLYPTAFCFRQRPPTRGKLGRRPMPGSRQRRSAGTLSLRAAARSRGGGTAAALFLAQQGVGPGGLVRRQRRVRLGLVVEVVLVAAVVVAAVKQRLQVERHVGV